MLKLLKLLKLLLRNAKGRLLVNCKLYFDLEYAKRERELHVDTVTACKQYYPRQNSAKLQDHCMNLLQDLLPLH